VRRARAYVRARVRACAGGASAGREALQLLSGFSFGASTAALFARVAGGIYTKAVNNDVNRMHGA
jgi:Na+/H+-translocating membrane pyrophosphatase